MAFENSKWIWIDNENAPDTYGEFCFTLKKGRGTYMNLSCDGDYTLFVNGEYVSSGQYGDFEHYKIYDTVSLDKYLTNEENRVCILVWHIGVASSRYRPYKAGAIFEVCNENGMVLSSDESILSRKSHAYKNGLCKQITSQLGIGYSYDFTKEDEWLTCAVEGFLPSHVVEKSAKLYPRPIKKHYLDAFKAVTQIGTSRVYDLGREYVGFLCFEIEAEEEGEINIAYGECLEGGRVKRKLGDRDFSVDYKLKKGKNAHTSYMLRFACRYLEIDTDVKIRVLKLGIIPQKYDVKRTSFKPSSELDAKIYDTCVNTLELCMMEHYVDCPWREQCLYAFDSRNQMLTGYYAFEGGNYDYARANLLLMSKDDRCDNLLSICFPCGIDLTIPSFSLYYVISLYEYLIHTGDKELVYTVNSKVKGLLDVFCANIEGSLQMNFEGAQYWNFFDWSDRLDGAIFSSEKKKIDIMLSLLTVIALKAYKEICKISEMEFSYQIVINELSQSFKEKLYDEKSGLVLLNGKALELPNALLVLSGILTKDEEQKICKAIMSGKLGECSLSMKCFVYDALIKSGEGAKEYILSKIRENYERMIETGTVWETLKGTHEFDNAGSLCHGWSAVPVYYYNLFYNIDRNK